VPIPSDNSKQTLNKTSI